MQRILILVLALTVLFAVPALAGRVATTPITHVIEVYQACPATSDCTCFAGYVDSMTPVISSAPGILCIEPGDSAWCNFVAAAQATHALHGQERDPNQGHPAAHSVPGQ